MHTLPRLLALLALAVTACSKPDNKVTRKVSAGQLAQTWTPGNIDAVMGVPSASVQQAITVRLAAERPALVNEDRWRHTKVLYKNFGDHPLWLDKDGVHDKRAMALLQSLIDAHSDALNLNEYPLADLARTIGATKSAHPTAQQLADADVLLTAAYTSLGEDLLTGQVSPKTVNGQDWHIDATEERVDSALVLTMRSEPLEKALLLMRPQDQEYDALRKELVRWRQIAAKGWATVPSGKPVRPGMSDSPTRLSALRSRLAAEELLSDSGAAAVAPPVQPTTTPVKTRVKPATAGSMYDHALAAAVARFQAQHGIGVDSMLGEETIKALNVTPAFRLGQIAANLERYRWLPRTLPERYVIVNVPAFRLEAYDSGEKSLEMKVIVGQEYEDKRTPVFADSMETVVFRPYWEVTNDIADKELFPKLSADPGLAERMDYEVVTQEGRPHIRQKPGPKNALGLVKFLFPNSFNIYMHDTPNGELFAKDVRAFSHGCIRLEKPAEMAQWALGWDAARVQEAMNGTDNHSVKLPHKIPVFIAYFTAYHRDGRLYFGNDLYKRDDALVDKVMAASSPSPEALRTVAELGKLIKS